MVGLVEQGRGMSLGEFRSRWCAFGVVLVGLALGTWLAVRSVRLGGDMIAGRNRDHADSPVVAVTPEQNSAAEPFAATLARVVAAGAEAIRLEAGDVRDAEIETLASVERLRVVRVLGGQLSVNAGRALASMPHLEQLHLRDVELDDETLDALSQSRSLWLLNVVGRGFSHAGIDRLADLRTLRQLRLGLDGGDDRVAEAIARIRTLRSVHLIGSGTTGQGLRALAGLPKLQSLYLDDCKISDEDWTWLFQSHPQLHVHIDQGHHDRDPSRHPHAMTREGQTGLP